MVSSSFKFKTDFAWYKDGKHSNEELAPGGPDANDKNDKTAPGKRLMSLTDHEVKQGQTVIAPAGLTVEVDATFKKGLTVEVAATSNVKFSGGEDETKVNTVDIMRRSRHDAHPTGLALYVTGAWPVGRTRGDLGDEGFGLVEFRDFVSVCGVGFGINSSGGTIYAAGSRQNQSLYVRAKGTGTVKVKQEDWIEPPGANFVNGWKNANAAFFKDGLGIVHFRGLVFKDGGVGAREDIFNLPDEYKCAIEARYIVPWSNSNNRGYGYLDISNGVKVTLGGNPPASHILVHLDGVTFPASSP